MKTKQTERKQKMDREKMLYMCNRQKTDLMCVQ